MEIFNVGPLELLLILILAVIVFGPEDLVKYSRKAGRWIYKASKSEFWQSVVGTSKEIKDFPRQIMKDAQIEESMKEINALNQSIGSPPASKSLPEPDPAVSSPQADEVPEKKEDPPKEN